MVENTKQEIENLLAEALELTDGDCNNVFTSPNGKLRVGGNVFVGPIQKRTSGKRISNVVKTIGYKLYYVEVEKELNDLRENLRNKRKEMVLSKNNDLMSVVAELELKIKELEPYEWKYVEKLEAIDLVRQLGVTNATIRPRRQPLKDINGTAVGCNINLNLHPIKGERPFTDGDRLCPVFKLDKQGKAIKPTELSISEEDCTVLMWEAIQDCYKTRKSKNPKPYNKISVEEKLSRIDIALAAANFKRAENPFERKN